MSAIQTTQPNFIHLHVHSSYSLAEGAMKIGKLLDACVKGDMPAIAVTDTNNLFGAMDFCLNAVKKGIQPIIGIQMSLCLPQQEANAFAKQKNCLTPIVLLAQSEEGYRNLCRLNSRMYTDKQPMDEVMLTLPMLEGFAEGLICLTGGAEGPLAVLLKEQKHEAAESLLEKLQALFPDRLYIELTRHGNWSRKLDKQLIEMAHKHDVPLVATNNAYFLNPSFYEAHDALLCIAAGRYISENDRRRETPDHYLKSPQEMVSLFHDVPEAIQNTILIARRCHFYLKEIKPELPHFISDAGRTEEDEIRHQAREGLIWRLENYIYPVIDDQKECQRLEKQYIERLEMELDVIIKMGFSGYFLVVADFIKWSKANDIPVGPGRGSGAGSLVAWSLRITDIDPIEYVLIFERFLNPERVSMPDFDIDFCQERRDEVIAYVQQKYGKANVGQIITFGELKARAVVRDVGRVLQMPYGQVDRISKMIPNNPAKPVTLQEAIDTDPELKKLKDNDEAVGRLLDIGLQLEGLYRHASVHAAGIVIGNKPLSEIVPLYQDSRAALPATQYNLKYIEQTGLVKFDFLGLKTLTVLQRALRNIRESTGDEIDLLALPTDNKKAYDLAAKGQTIGIFQFESSGMQDSMRKVKPDRIQDLIALNALYRPGPMQNIPQYGKVKNGEAKAEYSHEKVKPILEETHGIMVYQEQVMEIAKVLAGYTMGGADLLRRAMGKKIKAEMDAQRENFIKGAQEYSQLSEVHAATIFEMMAKFADYGFPRAHAAAYGLMAYHTAYLKANYPVEFMAALMTLDMHDTDALSIYTQDLARMNITLLPPCINKSQPHFAVEKTEKGKAVRYALAALKGVGQHAMHDLVTERDKKGPFKDLLDFVTRVNAQSFSKKQLEVLACAGAFDPLGILRAAVHQASDYLMRRIQRRAEEAKSSQVSLFATAPQMGEAEPLKMPDTDEWPAMEKLQHEFSAVGFYLSAHPVDAFGEWLDKKNFVDYRQIAETKPPLVTAKIAAVVIRKTEKKSERGRFAFITVSDRSGVFDVTVYTEPLMQYRDMLVPGNLLSFNVDVQWREGQARLIVRGCQKLEEAMTRSIRQVHLTLTPKADAVKLAHYLAKCEHGNIRVSLDVPVAEAKSMATMQIGHGVKLVETDIQALRGFSGVDVLVQ